MLFPQMLRMKNKIRSQSAYRAIHYLEKEGEKYERLP